jgi:hypothetical protein
MKNQNPIAQPGTVRQLKLWLIQLTFLRAVYQNSSVPLPVRIRCAVECLPFESPKLSATAIVQGQDFATLLDARLRWADKLNGEGTRLIEEKVEPEPEIKQGQPCRSQGRASCHKAVASSVSWRLRSGSNSEPASSARVKAAGRRQ